MRPTFPILAAIVLIASSSVDASPFSQRKGYIQNAQGKQCWYTQRVEGESTYFHGTLKGQTGILTFESPQCMRDSGLGLEVNKMLINNIIVRRYSHADAAFQTRAEELFPGSMMQKRGYCIQSRKYPQIAVTVDYVIQRGSIVQVYHGSSIQGCTK